MAAKVAYPLTDIYSLPQQMSAPVNTASDRDTSSKRFSVFRQSEPGSSSSWRDELEKGLSSKPNGLGFDGRPSIEGRYPRPASTMSISQPRRDYSAYVAQTPQHRESTSTVSSRYSQSSPSSNQYLPPSNELGALQPEHATNGHQIRNGSTPPSGPPAPQPQKHRRGVSDVPLQQQLRNPYPQSGRVVSVPNPVTPEGIHDMNRVVSFFASRKFYAEGYIYKVVERGGDGKPVTPREPAGRWDKWYVQLAGTELSMWNAREMEDAAARGSTVPPQYLRIADSHVTIVDSLRKDQQLPPGCKFAFALNNAGSYVLTRNIFLIKRTDTFLDRNRVVFAVDDENKLQKWVNMLRLAEWESSRLQE
jgi:hypothetical protein